MGTASLTLTVLAFSAPIAVVSGFIPITISFGGAGATFGFIIVTAVLLLFSVGYVAMSRHVRRPGGFYSFISTGLGKTTGLGAAFLAVSSYMLMVAGVYAQLGVTFSNFVSSLGGGDTSWLVWAVGGWLIVSTLSYFHIDLSAKILCVAMVLEVALVMIYNVAVIVRGGAQGLTLTPLSPIEFAHGNVGVALLFSVLVYLGFESTALFRDEVRTPDRTIPRATYTAVLFVGGLYILSCYTLTVAHGADAVEVASSSPATMFADSIGVFVAPAFSQLSYLLVSTSVLAALLSIQNVVARYLHNLACDTALPRHFARVHPRHGSPHRAAVLAAGAIAVLLGAFVLANNDGETLYAQLTGLSAVGVLALMAMVSLSVVVWFRRTGRSAGESRLNVFAAPAVACIFLVTTVVLALVHFELVVGGEPGERFWLIALPLGGFAVGVMLALHFRARKPEVFSLLGRSDRAVEDSNALLESDSKG